MSHTLYHATVTNLRTLSSSGLALPAGLVEAVEQDIAGELTTRTPQAELAARLRLARSGESCTQSTALRALRTKLTPTQVWCALIRLEKVDPAPMSTYLSVVMRDGLLPHDRSLLPLLAMGGSERLRCDALLAAMYEAQTSGCNLYLTSLAAGELTRADLVEVGHDGCEHLTREGVFDAVAGLTTIPAHDRLQMLFGSPTWWARRGAGPARMPGEPVVSDELLGKLHAFMSEHLEPIEVRYSDEWVRTLTYLVKDNPPVAGAVSDEQARVLREQSPGLATEVLLEWLGRGDRDTLLWGHSLAFLAHPWEIADGEGRARLESLVNSSHPSVAHLPNNVLEDVIVAAGKLHEVAWTIRRAVLRRRSDWRTAWLVDTHRPPRPEEVRELIQSGDLPAPGTVWAFRRVTPDVADVLLDTPGLPVAVARLIGESGLDTRAQQSAGAVLTAMMARMPADEQTRTRLLQRVLTATPDGNGPMDGNAQFTHAMGVLCARWDEQAQRLAARPAQQQNSRR